MIQLQRILFVCVGNICRSPMAEYLMKNKALSAGVDVQVSSAGISALTGDPAHPIVQELMTDCGIDISSHRARQLNSALLHHADLVLVMEKWQQSEIERMTPSARGKVHTLGRWQGFDVPDPYRKERAAFENALMLIESAITDWGEKLWSVR